RVNFAARTVITPDPFINIDEIGLPEVFAKKLSYVVPVTPWNVEELRRLVINGPNVHPGALILKTNLLTPSSNPGKESMKFVYRHLQTGDRMLLNRQPTLHKPSIMSHRARVLKGEKVMLLQRGFRCDEMNAHFPQNEVARAESQNIVSVCEQYLVPKDGTPLQGLIQDHVIAGVKMTVRRIKVLPPCIMKPKLLWSGKQIISTILLNSVPSGKDPITLSSTTKIKPSEWTNEKPRIWATRRVKGPSSKKGCLMCESEVIFRQGELLCGVMDKNQYGATMYSSYTLFMSSMVERALVSFSRRLVIFTNFLHTEGFTLGVSDILVRCDANKSRSEIMSELKDIGDDCASSGVALKGDLSELKSELRRFHRESYKAPQKRMRGIRVIRRGLGPITNRINSACLPRGLIKKFPYNNLQLMVQAGAKGSTVNTMQISCLLGQIELEGKRPPLMISGRNGRFMTGIKPQEFFFHCMAGREGLIDTAVKTSRSGYLQRCLIKLLEGLVVNYDLTVRDSDGSVVQFQYGEDSLDVCKSQFIVPKQLSFLEDNMNSVLDPSTRKLVAQHCLSNASSRMKKASKNAKTRDGGFLRFSVDNSTPEDDDDHRIDPKTGRTLKSSRMIKAWWANEQLRAEYDKAIVKIPDPCASVYRPDSNFGSVAEKVEDLIHGYMSTNPNRDEEAFKEMMYGKYMKSMVDPGEPVGVIAGQSIGEPSTQMTLNTFHFAGCGEMNVTLGIPRLREILMVASDKIKTPSSIIPFHPHISEASKDKLRLKLNRCILTDVLEMITVTEKLSLEGSSTRQKVVRMKFQFLPRKAYKNDFCEDRVAVIEMGKGSDKKGEGKKRGEEFEAEDNGENTMDQRKRGGKGFDAEEHASSDEEDQPDDADATDARKINRQKMKTMMKAI
ncbi:DNA-directed RNA polymerase subunit, partial [Caligus rogercresseyi]